MSPVNSIHTSVCRINMLMRFSFESGKSGKETAFLQESMIFAFCFEGCNQCSRSESGRRIVEEDELTK